MKQCRWISNTKHFSIPKYPHVPRAQLCNLTGFNVLDLGISTCTWKKIRLLLGQCKPPWMFIGFKNGVVGKLTDFLGNQECFQVWLYGKDRFYDPSQKTLLLFTMLLCTGTSQECSLHRCPAEEKQKGDFSLVIMLCFLPVILPLFCGGFFPLAVLKTSGHLSFFHYILSWKYMIAGSFHVAEGP